jgi:hypothetical protein
MYYGHSPKLHLNTLKRRVGKRKLKKAIIFDMDGTLFQNSSSDLAHNRAS